VKTHALWAWSCGIGYAGPEWVWPKAVFDSLVNLVKSDFQITQKGNLINENVICGKNVAVYLKNQSKMKKRQH
jgi:hypothetical protein